MQFAVVKGQGGVSQVSRVQRPGQASRSALNPGLHSDHCWAVLALPLGGGEEDAQGLAAAWCLQGTVRQENIFKDQLEKSMVKLALTVRHCVQPSP